MGRSAWLDASDPNNSGCRYTPHHVPHLLALNGSTAPPWPLPRPHGHGGQHPLQEGVEFFRSARVVIFGGKVRSGNINRVDADRRILLKLVWACSILTSIFSSSAASHVRGEVRGEVRYGLFTPFRWVPLPPVLTPPSGGCGPHPLQLGVLIDGWLKNIPLPPHRRR